MTMIDELIQTRLSTSEAISSLDFSDDGDMLAAGDSCGRITVFRRESDKRKYRGYCKFQSHETEFDCLKSLVIESRILKVKWLHSGNPANFLLATNEKTIRLWKLSEINKVVEGSNTREKDGQLKKPSSVADLKVPVVKPALRVVEASSRKTFAHAHQYHINSISVNSDQETFLSSDDLRINLWNFEVTDIIFNIVDLKPTIIEELTEVITCAAFHPSECNLFVYASSKGAVRLCDMRASALCDRHAKLFNEDRGTGDFFVDLVSNITDVKLSHSGLYVMTRDFLTLKIWDIRSESHPVEVYSVDDTQSLRRNLCYLYDNDNLFDKFDCCWSHSDATVLTGYYNDTFKLFRRSDKHCKVVEVDTHSSFSAKTLSAYDSNDVMKRLPNGSGKRRKKSPEPFLEEEFSRKVLRAAWHPYEDIKAIATSGNLYLFQEGC